MKGDVSVVCSHLVCGSLFGWPHNTDIRLMSSQKALAELIIEPRGLCSIRKLGLEALKNQVGGCAAQPSPTLSQIRAQQNTWCFCLSSLQQVTGFLGRAMCYPSPRAAPSSLLPSSTFTTLKHLRDGQWGEAGPHLLPDNGH